MLYIKPEDRHKFDDAINNLQLPSDAGELNYLITFICDAYLQAKGKQYANIDEVIGVLECVKQELAGSYKDAKITENSDVCK